MIFFTLHNGIVSSATAPSVATRTIVSANPVSPIPVAYGTAFGSIPLPTLVPITLDNAAVINVGVSWSGPYNSTTPGPYTLDGALINLPPNVTPNPAIVSHVTVTVQSQNEDGIQVEKPKFTTSSPLGFLQYLPDDYSLTMDTYPCMIYLHGAGEKGDGSAGASGLDKVTANGPPKHIKNGWNAQVSGEKFMVFTPQTSQQSELAWTNDGIPFLEWLLTTSGYRIDLTRVYLLGFSMGACGAIKIAASSWNTTGATKIAAIGPSAISAGSWADANNLFAKGVVGWFSHSDSDELVPLDPTGERVPNRLIELGDDVLTSNASNAAALATKSIWSVYAGLSHSGTQDRAHRITHTAHNPNMYEWFLTKHL